MARDLHLPGVAARLSELRALYVPLCEDEARARLEAPARQDSERWAEEVAQRLRELRALCALTGYLHRARWQPSHKGTLGD